MKVLHSGLNMVSRNGNFCQKIWIWIFSQHWICKKVLVPTSYILYEAINLGYLNWAALSRAISAMLFLFSGQSEFTFYPFVKHAKNVVMHFILLIFQKKNTYIKEPLKEQNGCCFRRFCLSIWNSSCFSQMFPSKLMLNLRD